MGMPVNNSFSLPNRTRPRPVTKMRPPGVMQPTTPGIVFAGVSMWRFCEMSMADMLCIMSRSPSAFFDAHASNKSKVRCPSVRSISGKADGDDNLNTPFGPQPVTVLMSYEGGGGGGLRDANPAQKRLL